jgi:hypothetical protein
MNSRLFFILVISLVLFGCKKEDKTEPSKIDEIVGNYEGQSYSNSGWSLAGGNISKLTADTIIMNYWRASTGDPIKMRVTGNKIETKSQVFPASGHTNNPWKQYYFSYRLSIVGYYQNDSVHYTFQEEIKQEGDSIFRYFENGRTELHKILK